MYRFYGWESADVKDRNGLTPRDLYDLPKGRNTGVVLCECDDCVRNAVEIAEELMEWEIPLMPIERLRSVSGFPSVGVLKSLGPTHKGGVTMMPGEAMNRAISIVRGKRYENVKVFFDVLYILIATVICLMLIGKLAGVRKGRVIAALLVGNIIKVHNKVFEKVTKKT